MMKSVFLSFYLNINLCAKILCVNCCITNLLSENVSTVQNPDKHYFFVGSRRRWMVNLYKYFDKHSGLQNFFKNLQSLSFFPQIMHFSKNIFKNSRKKFCWLRWPNFKVRQELSLSNCTIMSHPLSKIFKFQHLLLNYLFLILI